MLHAVRQLITGSTVLTVGTINDSEFLKRSGTEVVSAALTESDITDLGTTVAMVADNLSVFAATTSAQLAGVISDGTGSGALVFATSPTLVTPALGTPASGVLTNCTGLPIGGLETNLQTQLQFFQGSFLETFDATVSSNGTTITLSLEQSGGGDLTMVFSDGYSTLDCTPADTVSLTAGTDTVPQENFTYVLQSTKALTNSTSGWPSAEHIKVAYTLVRSASSEQTNGPLINQNWNDHASDSNSMGHMVHMAERSRRLGAVYYSGAALTPTINSVPAPDELDIAVSSGTIYQMHAQTFPAFDTSGGDNIYVVNHNATPYTQTSDLETAITSDANGTSLANKYFNIVFWGVANKGSESFSPVMVNLPTGSYNNASDAINDTDGYDVYTMPDAFFRESSTGFLIARLTLKFGSGTNTLSNENQTDLRGFNPFTASGAGTVASNEFIDSVFRIQDEGDTTKELAFQVSGVTTGTTRTVTVQDADGTMALQEDDLSVFAATTSAQLAGVISDETGSGPLVFGTNPAITTPTLTGDIVFAERADHASTPGAGFGYLWVKNTAPSTLIFTDDTGADTTLGSGGGAPTNAQYVTLATDATLSDERVLTGTANQITVTDGGAGSTVTLSTPQDIHTGATPTFSGLTVSGALTFGITGQVRTDTTSSTTVLLQAYDVDGAAYTTFITLTAANDPTCAIQNSSLTSCTGNISQWTNDSGYITDVTGDNLSALADVTIAAIASGEILKWNGSAWINNTLAEAGIAAASHTHPASEISDASANGQSLITAANYAAMKALLDLEIGTDVQAWSAVLDATTASFTTADETKLDGIETGADVTDATNVDAAGAVMNSDTSTAAMSFVIDEDDMNSDSATKVPSQQSVKAYADGIGLASSKITTDGNVTGTVGILTVWDISGLTADRDFTLPATAAVDQYCGLFIQTGDDAYEVALKNAASDTINGTNHASTAFDKTFRTGELWIFRCVTANTDWILEKKIKRLCTASIRRESTQGSFGSGAFTKHQLSTEQWDEGDIADATTNYRITVRRAGKYALSWRAGFWTVSVSTGVYPAIPSVFLNGTRHRDAVNNSDPDSSTTYASGGYVSGFAEVSLADGDYLELHTYHDAGSTLTHGASAESTYPFLQVREL